MNLTFYYACKLVEIYEGQRPKKGKMFGFGFNSLETSPLIKLVSSSGFGGSVSGDKGEAS